MISLLKNEKVYAYNFKGTRYDIGSKEGFLKATIDYSLRRDDLKEEILKFIKEKVQ